MYYYLKNIDVIFFDLDGTLVDIKQRQYQVYVDVLKSLNQKYIQSFEEYWHFKTSRTNIRTILEKTDAQSQLDEFLLIRSKLIEEPYYLEKDVIIKNVVKVLSELTNHFDIKVLTARKNYEKTVEHLHDLGLLKYFSEVICCGEKHHILRQEKYHDKNLLIVGDTEKEIKAAANVNCKCISLSTGIRNNQFLLQNNAEIIFDDIVSLLSSQKIEQM